MSEPISITQVMCDFSEHQGQPVSALCISAKCKAKSACCTQCLLKFHRECLDEIKFFQDVPVLVNIFESLDTLLIEFESTVKQVLKKIKKTLDSFLSPIKEYKEDPNLGNLNKIGQMLKKYPQTFMNKWIRESKSIINDQFTKLITKLSNYEEKQDVAKNLDKFEQINNVRSQDWQKQGQQCLDRVIQFNQKNWEIWLKKGIFLYDIDSYDESINSLNTSIKLKPSSDAYIYKGKIYIKLYQLGYQPARINRMPQSIAISKDLKCFRMIWALNYNYIYQNLRFNKIEIIIYLLIQYNINRQLQVHHLIFQKLLAIYWMISRKICSFTIS